VLHPSFVTVTGYFGERVTPSGFIIVPASVDGVTTSMRFLVVPGSGPILLGREAIATLAPLRESLKYTLLGQGCDYHRDRGSADLVAHQEVSTPGVVESPLLSQLLGEFEDVFADSLGVYNGPPVELTLKEGVVPKFYRARPVPMALRAAVESEINKGVKDGIYRPIEFSQWATPLVVVAKKGGKVRLCGDYRSTVNASILPDPYPLPRISDMLARLGGKKYFTKMDVRQAYQQVRLTPRSARIAAVNTHKGLFAVDRLPFGTISSSGVFQRIMDTMFADLDDVMAYQDDILIATSTIEQHLQVLAEVLSRLRKANLRLVKDKCEFMVSSVTYLGFQVGQCGILPAKDNVHAIVNMPPPQNVSELRSFMGMVQFYLHFLPHFTEKAEELRALLAADVPWQWSSIHQSIFDRIKQMIVSADCLSHYSLTLPLVLVVDASPVGVGAVLNHVMSDGREAPVLYASKSLSPTQRRYSQTDREALAIVYAVQKFHQFLSGRHFKIITDHKPLLGIFGSDRPTPNIISPKLLRWSLILAGYDYVLEHRAGLDIPTADALSRLPLPTDRQIPDWERELEEDTASIAFLSQDAIVTPMQLEFATLMDAELQHVVHALRHGWPQQVDPILTPYKSRGAELSLRGDIVLWGQRAIIPLTLRTRVMQLLHEGHVGIVAMKNRAAMTIWWPGITKHIEDHVARCEICQKTQHAPPRNEPVLWPRPSRPWGRVHLDFAGPVKGKMFLIIVDAFSGWMHVEATNGATSAVVIATLRRKCADFGLPDTIVSDNAPTFSSAEFKGFVNRNGFTHLFSPAYHPQSNGRAERAVQTFKGKLTKLGMTDLQQQLDRFLFYQHSTPGADGISPAMLMLKGRFRTHLDVLRPHHDASHYHVRGAANRRFSSGADVWMRSYKRGDPPWIQAVVIRRRGEVVYDVKESQTQQLTQRHVNQLRPRLPADVQRIPTKSQETSDKPVPETAQVGTWNPIPVTGPSIPISWKGPLPTSTASPVESSSPPVTSGPVVHRSDAQVPEPAPFAPLTPAGSNAVHHTQPRPPTPAPEFIAMWNRQLQIEDALDRRFGDLEQQVVTAQQTPPQRRSSIQEMVTPAVQSPNGSGYQTPDDPSSSDNSPDSSDIPDDEEYLPSRESLGEYHRQVTNDPLRNITIRRGKRR
jgi:hypothetical protein